MDVGLRKSLLSASSLLVSSSPPPKKTTFATVGVVCQEVEPWLLGGKLTTWKDFLEQKKSSHEDVSLFMHFLVWLYTLRVQTCPNLHLIIKVFSMRWSILGLGTPDEKEVQLDQAVHF